MTAFRHDVSGAVEAYAAYLNAPRGFLDHEEQQLFDEDMARARAPSGSRVLALRTAVRRVERRAFARA